MGHSFLLNSFLPIVAGLYNGLELEEKYIQEILLHISSPLLFSILLDPENFFGSHLASLEAC